MNQYNSPKDIAKKLYKESFGPNGWQDDDLPDFPGKAPKELPHGITPKDREVPDKVQHDLGQLKVWAKSMAGLMFRQAIAQTAEELRGQMYSSGNNLSENEVHDAFLSTLERFLSTAIKHIDGHAIALYIAELTKNFFDTL